jgi:hypothetical protein
MFTSSPSSSTSILHVYGTMQHYRQQLLQSWEQGDNSVLSHRNSSSLVNASISVFGQTTKRLAFHFPINVAFPNNFPALVFWKFHGASESQERCSRTEYTRNRGLELLAALIQPDPLHYHHKFELEHLSVPSNGLNPP